MTHESVHELESDTPPIQPTTFKEAVRKRAPMYIGDVGEWGMHNMVFDIVDDSLNEKAKGFAQSISMVLSSDGSLKIHDDGRGVPTEALDEGFKRPLVPWKSIRAERDTLPILVACCLSERFRMQNRHKGRMIVHEFHEGNPVGPPIDSGPSSQTGIDLEFKPDVSIFGTTRLNGRILRDRLEECASLHSGIMISFVDESTGTESRFCFENGIRSFVARINENRTPLHDVAVLKGHENGIHFEVGIQFCKERDELVRCYVNDFRCDMGTHVTGVRNALRHSLKRFVRTTQRISNDSFHWTSRNKGLTTIISIRMAEPQFFGATREKLANPDVEKILVGELGKSLDDYFSGKPDTATAIIDAGLRQ